MNFTAPIYQNARPTMLAVMQTAMQAAVLGLMGVALGISSTAHAQETARETTQVSARALMLPAPATRTFEQVETTGRYAMPIGPYLQDQVEMLMLNGAFSLEAWRLAGNAQPSHILMAEFSRQLADSGYEILYQCAEIQCGGFDFRFKINVIPEPFMHIDLGDYQFLAAHKPSADASKETGDTGDYVTLLVSRSPGAGFVQIARIGPPQPDGATDTALATVTSTMTDPNAGTTPGRGQSDAAIDVQLAQNGFAVLAGLEFETGSSDLGAGPFDSLRQLAGYLDTHPDATVALVGHSDAEGALAVNITLSKRRAASVRTRLIDLYDLPAAQLTAEGIGFLAPLGSNATDQGRTQNRRVEVVLTSTR